MNAAKSSFGKLLVISTTLLVNTASSWSFATDLPARGRFEVRVGRRQLFLDDVDIERIDNLTRSNASTCQTWSRAAEPDPLQAVQIRTAPVWVSERHAVSFCGCWEPIRPCGRVWTV